MMAVVMSNNSNYAVNSNVAEPSKLIRNIFGQCIEAACCPTVLEIYKQSIQWSLAFDIALLKENSSSAQDHQNRGRKQR